jgi:hypothetical protein
MPRLSPRVVRGGAVLLGVILILCVGWVFFRSLATNTLQRALGLEPTAIPTQTAQVIYVLPTAVLPVPLSIPTALPRTSTTPARGAAAPTARPVATPVLAPYPAPQPINPPNATVFNGSTASIVLEWRPVSNSGLRENEWYRISISYQGRDSRPVEQIRWSKETHCTLLGEWWDDISSETRTVNWNVIVMQIQGIDPFASPNNVPISPSSETRSFIWN